MQIEKIFENALGRVVNRGGKREDSQGLLVVLGGPGGTGLSTIARRVAERLNLLYVYSGGIMRDIAIQNGYSDIESFLTSDIVKRAEGLIDFAVEKETILKSQLRDVLIDSKAFAGISSILKIPTSAKIWITADVDIRVHRVYEKYGLAKQGDVLDKNSAQYIKTKEKLLSRVAADEERFGKYYGVDYAHPENHNDYVIDTSFLTVDESVEEVLNKLVEHGAISLKQAGFEKDKNSSPVEKNNIEDAVGTVIGGVDDDELEAVGEIAEVDEVHPEDLDERWTRWKCLVCNYLYEGQTAVHKCPRCGNEDPDMFD